MRTYTKMRLDPVAFVRDAVTLYRMRTRDVASRARATVEAARVFEDRLRELTGSGLRGKRLLIVGTGQTLREFFTFGALGAKVTGIDLDVVPLGFDPLAYVRLLRQNGPVRFAKTAGRKLLGIDRAFEAALANALGVDRLERGTLLSMDATQMSFPDASFDVVYSFSVFEHLPDPARVLAEVRRVLAPGGVARISTHLYSSFSGCHDMRLFADAHAPIPAWAHLRPAQKQHSREDCYMNEWSLAQWRELFERDLPGCRIEYQPNHASFDAELREKLRTLRAAGELTDYSDEDLLTVNVICEWKKA